jgi:hypothetical protein
MFKKCKSLLLIAMFFILSGTILSDQSQFEDQGFIKFWGLHIEKVTKFNYVMSKDEIGYIELTGDMRIIIFFGKDLKLDKTLVMYYKSQSDAETVFQDMQTQLVR